MLMQSSFVDPHEARIRRAIKQIKGDYGHDVSVEKKNKYLVKFGRHNTLGTSLETVWVRGGDESYPTGDVIDSLSSSNANDDQEVKIEGHRVHANGLEFIVQTATLNGQNRVPITPIKRATRLYNNDDTNFAGTVYVFENDSLTNGVPQTSAKIHLQSDGTTNQTLKCATALSWVDYWILTGITASVDRQQTRSVDFRLEVREQNKVFRNLFPISANSNSGGIYVPFNPCLIVRPNSDVRMRAVASSTGTGVDASIQGLLAIRLN